MPPTAQEVFDQIVAHLRVQGKKSILDHQGMEVCAYRSLDPVDGKVLKCAVGCLIKDEEYDPLMEATNVYHILRKMATISPSLRERLEHHHNLLTSMQEVHDGFPVERWESQFHAVASFHGVTYTPPQS